MTGSVKSDEPDDRIFVAGKGFERYENALKNLIPVRRGNKEIKAAPIDRAGLISTIFFSWISRVMLKAHRSGIDIEELPKLSSYDAGIYNADRMEILWKKELARKGPERASLALVAWKFCQTRVLVSSLIFVLSLIAGLLTYTLVMQSLLEHVQSESRSQTETAKWAGLLIIGEISRITFLAWSWSLNYRSALKLRSACLTLLYRKIILVDNLEGGNIGKVINMFSNDAQRIFDVVCFGPLVIGAPITTVIAVFYILWLLGPMAFIGMAAFLVFFPIQYLMSRLLGYFQNKAMKVADMRVRLMNEILDCMKLIKMYAWERRFSKDLLDIRKTERRLLIKTSLCNCFSSAMLPAMPVISAIITFLAHLSTGQNLTTAQVFSYVTLLDAGLRTSLSFFQDAIESIVTSRISFKRLKSLLLLDVGNCPVSKPKLESQALVISNGTFTYGTSSDHKEVAISEENGKDRNNLQVGDSEERTEQERLNKPADSSEPVNVLFDVNFEAEKGKLVGICGQVGSGKSSLLLAGLGQLRVIDGQVMRDGSCAYVSQQAWITNATLRENILFGSKFDQSRYDKTITACNLIQDIEMMPGGDQTEIGEKGVNLSGGQKQRVALARALYADRDIYFLDDPLSAVDARVGSYIFDNLILGALKGKTVLFVTHQIQYLNRCDDVYMMRDGRIIEHGTHEELLKLGNEYSSMVNAISAISDADRDQNQEPTTVPKSVVDSKSLEADTGTKVNPELVSEFNAANTQLTVAENLEKGTIKAYTYISYVKAAGGYFFIFIVLLAYLATDASLAFAPWWLALWIRAGGGNNTMVRNNVTVPSDNLFDNPDFGYYQTVYASMIGVIGLTSLVRSLLYTKTTIAVSTKMHNNLFKKIITSPMRFFDTTPVGRIQHLFSRDMDEVDHRLPIVLTYVLQNCIMVFMAMLIISLVFPWFILPLCVIGVFYFFVSKIFRVAIRDLKRMDNKARAPIISFVTASAQGLSTIHAFGKENDFTKKFSKLFDENSNCLFIYSAATRWLASRIDVLSLVITAVTAIFIIALQDQVPPSLAGLALAYSMQISGVFQYTIRTLSDAEVRFISVERISHYLKVLKVEGEEKTATVKPPETWPAAAEIKFTNVCMAYGEGAPFILKNVAFSIRAGEKIGIVGRTGSGKSSLTVALFRLVEIAQGKIEIDDIDISEITLEQLRNKLSIIPQDPILFSGTIRSNLDPFGLHTDAEIWLALEKTELKTKVQLITGELDASVGFGGDNLSVGERQLLCLTRALLRNSKILILDEATAAVDPETERAVQKTIQDEFSNCTILTIAHRLQTVLSLDRILVMHDGKVLEFDTPSNLLSNKSSEFSKMLEAAEKAEKK